MAIFAVPSFAYAGTAQDPPPEPSIQDVYVVMRDMDLGYENVQIRTIVPTEAGASAMAR